MTLLSEQLIASVASNLRLKGVPGQIKLNRASSESGPEADPKRVGILLCIVPMNILVAKNHII